MFWVTWLDRAKLTVFQALKCKTVLSEKELDQVNINKKCIDILND
jgi:hypothetical protein